jgi:DNA-binding transcriptional LysR family regulator
VRIATIDRHQSTLLPAMVARLRHEAPGLDLQIRGIDRHRLHDQLATGELDLAIAPILAGHHDLRSEPLWKDRLVTLIGERYPRALPMTLEAFAAAAHVVDAGHVQVTPDGRATSLVDTILAARGLRRRIAVVLPSSAGVTAVVAATDLVATLPSRIVSDLAVTAGVKVIAAPLPPVEVSAHLFWHLRTPNSPLRAWLRAVIKDVAGSLAAV